MLDLGSMLEVAPDVLCLGPWGRTQTNVYLVRAGSSWSLVDAGWASDVGRIQDAVAGVLGRSAHPDAIVITHAHPDHSGSAKELALAWHCSVFMGKDEIPIALQDFGAMQRFAGPMDRWMVLPVMRAMGTRRREQLFARQSLGDLAVALEPAEPIPGMPGWRAIPTPGHTPGHLSLHRPEDGVLLTGDALVTLQVNSISGILRQRPGLSGPPWYTTWDQAAAIGSIETLAGLEPTVIAGGHGYPMADGSPAERLRELVRHLAR